MNGITILDNDTIVVKLDKLQRIIDASVWRQVSKLEKKILEISQDNDRILTKNQVMEMLEISPSTFDNWVRNKRLKTHKIGDKNFLNMSDVKSAMKPIN